MESHLGKMIEKPVLRSSEKKEPRMVSIKILERGAVSRTVSEMGASACARTGGNKLVREMMRRLLTTRDTDRRSNRQKTQPVFKLEHGPFHKGTACHCA